MLSSHEVRLPTGSPHQTTEIYQFNTLGSKCTIARSLTVVMNDADLAIRGSHMMLSE